MNALSKHEAAALPALQMNEAELVKVLQSSLYPGAALESIKMVLGYCKASGLDPMQKPVHIVPMWDGKAGTMRDVVMPGIGMYRIQASRSNVYAGITEPEFGDDVTENIGGVSVTYPKSCRVIVKRLLPNGTIAEFASVERWKENYAAKGGKDKSVAPNAMWAKRPYAQLAKCAQAQALRMAFPEIGASPTAEEIEGKTLDEDFIEMESPKVVEKKVYTDAEFDEKSAAWQQVVTNGTKRPDDLIAFIESKTNTLTEAQKLTIRGWEIVNANA
jgi:phage recombination protein Bet